MTDNNDATARELGLEALRSRRYQQAVEHLARYCELHPDDVEATMELGLAELLLGQRTQFASRYESLSRRFSVASPPTARARALWDRCRRVGESMAAAALLLTAAGIPATSAGCAKTSPPEQSPPATVQVPLSDSPETSVETPEPTVKPDPTEEVVEVPTPDETAPGPAASAPPTPTPIPTPTRDYPKTRYVAVRPDPVPNLVP